MASGASANRALWIARKTHVDARGVLFKVIDGTEPRLPQGIGEFYVATLLPGMSRGGHYHVRTHEWFTVIEGKVNALVWDVGTGRLGEFELDGGTPGTLYVPAGTAHFFRNRHQSTAIMVAYANQRYDPADTIKADLENFGGRRT